MEVSDLINKEKNWTRYFPREMYTTELFQAFTTWFLKLAKKRFNFVYLNNLEKRPSAVPLCQTDSRAED